MQQRFLLQILLLAQHVSGITMPIIRSSRVLYSENTLYTKLNRSIQNIQPYLQWNTTEPKEYARSSNTSYGLYIF